MATDLPLRDRAIRAVLFMSNITAGAILAALIAFFGVLLLEAECGGLIGCALSKLSVALLPEFITALIIFLILRWFYGHLKDQYGVDLERGVFVREVGEL